MTDNPDRKAAIEAIENAPYTTKPGRMGPVFLDAALSIPPSDARIEAVAKAMWENIPIDELKHWHEVPDDDVGKQHWRKRAKAALAADREYMKSNAS